MQVITACRDCGGPLPITGTTTTVHPHCTLTHTRIEQLANQWLEAVLDNNTILEAKLQKQILAIETKPPKLKAAALQYAAWGWPVFPLMPKSKRPATKNGFKAATTDRKQIRQWWDIKPDCNIGLPTGRTFDVIDIDLPAGINAYQKIMDTDTEVHGQVATARGGVHLYIPPRGKRNSASASRGVDYRGDGGYVVAPPSTLGERGRSWSWVHYPSPTLTQTMAGAK